MSRPIGGKLPQTFPSLLHDSQQKLAPHASREQIEQANQDAVDAAIA